MPEQVSGRFPSAILSPFSEAGFGFFKVDSRLFCSPAWSSSSPGIPTAERPYRVVI